MWIRLNLRASTLVVRPTFPMVWMPWELKMLQPYLTPQELPDTQLKEIYDYAMTFAQNNNNDVIETLFDINMSFFREYKYVPGATNFATTAVEVLTSRQGVCQDFANLFIAMARLMSIPGTLCLRLYLLSPATSSPIPRKRMAVRPGLLPMPRMPGCNFISRARDGRVSIQPTATCRTSITCASATFSAITRDTAPTMGTRLIFAPATET